MQNFDGLGIGFEVQDNGAEQKVSGISNSFDGLWTSVKSASSSVPKATASIARGLGRLGEKSSRYVGMVSTAIGSMVDSAMDPKLDTAYASMYAGYNKGFQELTAGMMDTDGALSAARKRIGGIAHGMGEDMNQAAQSWVSFRKQGIELDRMLGTSGLSGTIKQLIKTTSVFGLEGRQLANVAGVLKRRFGFTEEQIGELGDKIVAVGREFDMGRESMQSWPNIMSVLNKELAAFGDRLTPQKIDSLTTSIVQLGGGFHEALGVDATEATELALNAFTVLAGEGKNIARMAYGMGGPFSEMGKEIMAAGDDLNQVFDVMASKDPLKFMDMLREVGKVAQQRGGETGVAFQRLNAVINDTLGPDMAFATAGNWDAVTEKMRKMPDVIAASKGTLKEVAQAHWKSSLTAGDAWEMMMNNMRAKVFGLSRGEVKRWQKNMKQGFKESFGIVKAFADDKGPLGDLTRKLLAVQRVGLSALIPSLGSLAPILGGITQQALPMLTALGSMGIRFSDFGKLAGVGGGAYLLFQTLTKGPEAVVAKFTEMQNSLLDVLSKDVFKGKKNIGIRKSISELKTDLNTIGIVGAAKKQLQKIPWGDIWDTVWGKTDSIMRSIGKALKQIPWEDVGRTVFKWVGKGIAAIGGGIWDVVIGKNGEKAIDPFSKLIRDGVAGALNIVTDTAKGALKGLWDSIFKPDSIKDTFENIIKFATTGFGALLILSKGFRKKVGSGLWSAFMMPKGQPERGAVDYYGAGLPGIIPGVSPRPTTYRGYTEDDRYPRARGAGYQMVDAAFAERDRQGYGKHLLAAREIYPLRQAQERPVKDDTSILRRRPDYRRELSARSLSGVLMPKDMLFAGQQRIPSRMFQKDVDTRERKPTRRERFRQWRGEKRAQFDQTRVGRAVGGARRSLRKVGGIGGLSAIGGVVESTQQMTKRNELAQQLSHSRMLSEQEKFLVKTESNFLGVANVIDSMFLGLPGMVGKALGITEEDLSSFYHKMVAGAELGIFSIVEGFQFLGRTAKNIWNGISAGAQMLFADIDYGFGVAKNSALGVLYDIGEVLQTTVSGWGRKLMYPFEWFAFQMKTWMADFMESVFGRPGESNAITKVLSTVIGEDAVSGMQRYGKSVRDEQRAILGGEKTFDDMWKKNEQKRQKTDRQYWDDKRAKLKEERSALDAEAELTRRSIERQQKASGIDAIKRDFGKTRSAIARHAGKLMAEASENFEKVQSARETLAFEQKNRAASRSSTLESAARAQQELKDAEERSKGIRRRRRQPAKTEAEQGSEVKDVIPPKGPVIVSQQERAAAASSAPDLAKILEENKKTVAEMKKTMAAMQSSVQDLANRPINMSVVSKIDGKKVSEAVETYNRKTSRF